MRTTQLTSEEIKAIKVPLKKVFHLLRTKHNIAARMNFSCCGNCGSYELEEIIKKKNLDGYVFYHNQDEDNFKESGDVYLRYGAGEAAITAYGVGRLVVSVCKEVGLQTDWDGSSDKCVFVKGSEYLEQWNKGEAHREFIASLKREVIRYEDKMERLEELRAIAVADLTEIKRQLAEAEGNQNETNS